MEVTTLAIEKLREVMEEQGEQEAGLRVIAIPAETGGLQYMLTMENESQADDTEMNLEGVKFLMDSDSAPFLEEATIDYVENFGGQVGFVINNPMFAQAGGMRRGLRLRSRRRRWLRLRRWGLRRPLGRHAHNPGNRRPVWTPGGGLALKQPSPRRGLLVFRCGAFVKFRNLPQCYHPACTKHPGVTGGTKIGEVLAVSMGEIHPFLLAAGDYGTLASGGGTREYS